ncbi:NmrA family NAD(P)-binding protein [Kineococcus sp. LSe6-4]|uniref:NmrA family NAD(P)-binding protein n=1 Tax=Kineococcus halophytocola TaxID=3234027 RepID=A0ABV4GZY1_9ACTN
MIVVIGGNGKTGRRVAGRLTGRGEQVRVVSRSTSPRFDWDDASTWEAALAGAGAAYVTYHPDLAFPGVPEFNARFSATARAAGLRKAVLLSGRGEEGALASERALQESGLAWTVVRCNWFDQNFSESFFLGPVSSGVLSIPAGEAREPFVDADDIADVATAALLDPRHDGEVYELSGPRLLTFTEVARELSAATDREIRYEPVSHEEYVAELQREGLPADFADLFATILDGRNASVTDGVQRALGRPPRDFSDYAARTAATGVWTSSRLPAAPSLR